MGGYLRSITCQGTWDLSLLLGPCVQLAGGLWGSEGPPAVHPPAAPGACPITRPMIPVGGGLILLLGFETSA